MNLMPAVSLLNGLIDRFVPNKAEAARAVAEIAKMEQSGELKLALGQMAINMEEAKHPSVWVSGWRPYIGWICGTGLLYQSVLVHIIPRTAGAPPIDTHTLLIVLTTLLGAGSILRTVEKVKGVAQVRLGKQTG